MAIDTALTVDSLPVVQGVTQFQPSELGSVYLSVDPYGIEADQGVRLAFDGDDAVTWHVDALRVLADGTAAVDTMTVDSTGRGELTVGPLDDTLEVLVIFTNLGDGSRDPETPNCATGNGFVYDLGVADLAAPPAITGVDPGEVTLGEDHYLWVAGSDFVEGLAVSLGGAGITVHQVDFIDAKTIGVAVQVASDAPTGSRDLTVTNPNDETTTLAGAVTVGDPSGSTTVVTSCSCALVGDDPTQPVPWSLAALLTGVAALVTRRRRQG